MNKYELAVVLSAKLEDEERAAAMEKVTGYITRFGGTVTDIDEWGKKSLIPYARMRWRTTSASWSRLSDTYA